MKVLMVALLIILSCISLAMAGPLGDPIFGDLTDREVKIQWFGHMTGQAYWLGFTDGIFEVLWQQRFGDDKILKDHHRYRSRSEREQARIWKRSDPKFWEDLHVWYELAYQQGREASLNSTRK